MMNDDGMGLLDCGGGGDGFIIICLFRYTYNPQEARLDLPMQWIILSVSPRERPVSTQEAKYAQMHSLLCFVYCFVF